VLDEKEKKLHKEVAEKNKQDFRKKAGWGNWCGPDDFAEYKSENTLEKIQQKAQEKLKNEVRRPDFDG